MKVINDKEKRDSISKIAEVIIKKLCLKNKYFSIILLTVNIIMQIILYCLVVKFSLFFSLRIKIRRPLLFYLESIKYSKLDVKNEIKILNSNNEFSKVMLSINLIMKKITNEDPINNLAQVIRSTILVCWLITTQIKVYF